MKRKAIFILLLVLSFMLVACGEEKKKGDCTIECDDINIMLHDTAYITPTCSAGVVEFQYKYNNDMLEINGSTITAKNEGETKVTITAKGYNGSKEILVTIHEQGIKIKGQSTTIIEQTQELKLLRFGVDEDEKVTWKSDNNNVARVSKGTLTGINFGSAMITAQVGDFSDSFYVEIIRPEITEIVADSTIKYEKGGTYTLGYSVLPKYASEEVTLESSNDCLLINQDNTITIQKVGSAILKVTSKANEKITKEIAIEALESACPVFVKSSNYVETLEYNYGDAVDILAGLTVMDNADGDITSKIQYDETLLLAYGKHDIALTVTDIAGNETVFKRSVNVNWPYQTKFIGHSGCYYGVPNTEEAFLYAASVLHYQAIECDLHLTKDGIFVTNHDSYLTVDDGNGGTKKVVITETNYSDLVKYTITSGKYTGHVCTLQRYLEICKKYGCEAIIELKSTTGISDYSQDNVPKLINYIKSFDMYDQTILLTYSTTIMSWIRSHKYDIRMQYLVQGGDNDTVLNYCKKYNIMLSVNVTYGQGISDEYIQKYKDAGVKISTWTFSGKYDQVQEWIDKGVDYVTCDIHYMDQLELK